MKYIPEQHRHRVRYVQRDVRTLTYAELVTVLHDQGCEVSDVAHCHISPPCTTHSEAHHRNNFHRDGLDPVTPNAILDDDLSRGMCMLMAEFARHNPDVLLSQENPVGLWSQLPWVHDLARQQGAGSLFSALTIA